MRHVTVVSLLLLAGCGGERRAPQPPASSDSAAPAARAAAAEQVDSLMARVIPAAAVKLGVDASPYQADSILSSSGFTLERYEATLYAIAADSEASALFESALGR
jgi:hypothetical protein